MKDNKKGQFGLGSLQTAALGFVAVVIIMAIGGTILTEYRTTNQELQADGNVSMDYEYNVTSSGLDGLTTMSDFNPVIAIAISAVIILGIITAAFATQQ